MNNLWNKEDQRLLERLKKDILSGPNLSRPDPYIRFYIKTDCSKDGMVAVLLKADVSEEVRKSETQERDGKKCEFDKSLEGMGLQPISFISISKVSPLKKSRNIFVGEAAVVRCSIEKFRKYLWGS